MTNAPHMLTPKEVADKLGVHPKTVHLWLRSGKLQGIKISYRAWRIPQESLNSFINANSNRQNNQPNALHLATKTDPKKPEQKVGEQSNPEQVVDPQLKMKYYIQDIMGEKLQKNKNKE